MGNYHFTADLFLSFGFSCFAYVESSRYFFLVKTKPIKQVRHTVILPPRWSLGTDTSLKCRDQRSVSKNAKDHLDLLVSAGLTRDLKGCQDWKFTLKLSSFLVLLRSSILPAKSTYIKCSIFGSPIFGLSLFFSLIDFYLVLSLSVRLSKLDADLLIVPNSSIIFFSYI